MFRKPRNTGDERNRSEPLVAKAIILLPRPTASMAVLADLAAREAASCSVVALSDSAERTREFSRAWPDSHPVPLLILRSDTKEAIGYAVDAIVTIAGGHPGPTGVLIGDGPELAQYRELRREKWNQDFARALRKELAGAQIFEYSSDWRSSPPRIR